MVHRCSYALWPKLFRFLVSRSGSNSMPCCARTRSDNIPCQFKPVLAHLSELLDLVQYLCFLTITSSARLPRVLCQHIRPPSQRASGGSPLQPGCLKRCVKTEDLHLRVVAHLFNPAVSSVVSKQKTSVSERWLTSSTRLSQAFHMMALSLSPRPEDLPSRPRASPPLSPESEAPRSKQKRSRSPPSFCNRIEIKLL